MNGKVNGYVVARRCEECGRRIGDENIQANRCSALLTCPDCGKRYEFFKNPFLRGC